MIAPCATTYQPHIAALVLAAGRSTRMAPHNKLLLRDTAGIPVVARVVAECAASRLDHIVVVTGHQASLVERAVCEAGSPAGLRFIRAPAFADGLSASLRAGIEALPAGIDGVLVCLGDMPLVGAALIDRMLAAFAQGTGDGVVVPVWGNRRGNPVLWARRFFDEIRALTGDRGAGILLARHAGLVCTVDAEDAGVLLDVDTPAQAAGAFVPA